MLKKHAIRYHSITASDYTEKSGRNILELTGGIDRTGSWGVQMKNIAAILSFFLIFPQPIFATMLQDGEYPFNRSIHIL